MAVVMSQVIVTRTPFNNLRDSKWGSHDMAILCRPTGWTLLIHASWNPVTQTPRQCEQRKQSVAVEARVGP